MIRKTVFLIVIILVVSVIAAYYMTEYHMSIIGKM